jgi:hypothetical protein
MKHDGCDILKALFVAEKGESYNQEDASAVEIRNDRLRYPSVLSAEFCGYTLATVTLLITQATPPMKSPQPETRQHCEALSLRCCVTKIGKSIAFL